MAEVIAGWPPVSLDPVTPTVRKVAVYTNGRMLVQLTDGLQRGYIRGDRAEVVRWLRHLAADMLALAEAADAAPGRYHVENGQVTT